MLAIVLCLIKKNKLKMYSICHEILSFWETRCQMG